MNMGLKGKHTDRRKAKYWEKTLPQCPFVHQKFHIDLPGIQPGPPQ